MIGDVNLALMLLNTLLNYIGRLRAAGGLTDDALAAEVKKVTQDNNDAYNALIAALNAPPPALIPLKPITPPAQ